MLCCLKRIVTNDNIVTREGTVDTPALVQLLHVISPHQTQQLPAMANKDLTCCSLVIRVGLVSCLLCSVFPPDYNLVITHYYTGRHQALPTSPTSLWSCLSSLIGVWVIPAYFQASSISLEKHLETNYGRILSRYWSSTSRSSLYSLPSLHYCTHC